MFPSPRDTPTEPDRLDIEGVPKPDMEVLLDDALMGV